MYFTTPKWPAAKRFAPTVRLTSSTWAAGAPQNATRSYHSSTSHHSWASDAAVAPTAPSSSGQEPSQQVGQTREGIPVRQAEGRQGPGGRMGLGATDAGRHNEGKTSPPVHIVVFYPRLQRQTLRSGTAFLTSPFEGLARYTGSASSACQYICSAREIRSPHTIAARGWHFHVLI